MTVAEKQSLCWLPSLPWYGENTSTTRAPCLQVALATSGGVLQSYTEQLAWRLWKRRRAAWHRDEQRRHNAHLQQLRQNTSGIRQHRQKWDMLRSPLHAEHRLQRSSAAGQLVQKVANKRQETPAQCCCWCTRCHCRTLSCTGMPKNSTTAEEVAGTILRRSCGSIVKRGEA